jgi:hypothetical protein
LNRADLIRYVYELAHELKINYESPPPRRVMYNAGDLANGEVDTFKTNLLKAGNVKSRAWYDAVDKANSAAKNSPQKGDLASPEHAEEDSAGPLVQGE